MTRPGWYGGLFLLIGCAGVPPPPTVTDTASIAEREELYEQYRVDPLSNETAQRSDRGLSLWEFDELAGECPAADDLIHPLPRIWFFVGGAGGGMVGYSGTSLGREGERQYDETVDIGLLVGGSLLVVASLVALIAHQHDDHEVARATTEYNRCLRRDLGLPIERSAGPSSAEPTDAPWRAAPPPPPPPWRLAPPPPTSTSTGAPPR